MRKIAIILFALFLPFMAHAACTSDEIDILGDGTNCQTVKFSVTTTSDTDHLEFQLTPKGTFYIDCGDGGILAGQYDVSNNHTIERERGTSDNSWYMCDWASAGAHTVRFGGIATGYYSNYQTISFYRSTDGTQSHIASINGTLGTLFPRAGSKEPEFISTFNGTQITTIPSGLFTGLTGYGSMFDHTFAGTNITTIPNDLFADITTGATRMFAGTFRNCTSLTTVPDDMFDAFTTGYGHMFRETFRGCTSLTNMPSFHNIITAADNLFAYTFDGCSSLQGFIPPDMFAGLIAHGSPNVGTAMWCVTFRGTQLVKTCPVGTVQYFSGYEGSGYSTWSGYVSCQCDAGYYGTDSCTVCENTAPANGHFTIGSTTATCPWECDAGYYRNGDACSVCANTAPANGHFTVGATTATCPWECDSGYHDVSGVCEPLSCPSGQFAAGNGCVTEKFSVTTAATTTTFKFNISAAGTFYVDWGDGTSDVMIHNNTTLVRHSHNYASAGSYTIKLGGTATAYNTLTSDNDSTIAFWSSSGDTAGKIASVSGSLSAIFPQIGTDNGEYPRFINTFREATGLTTIPDTLFENLTGGTYMFYQTFFGCTALTAIPDDLFDDISNGASHMFLATFDGCSAITAIPDDLFANITTASDYLFERTFQNCTSLIAIPTGLFDSITTGASGIFKNTFNGCSTITAIPTGFFDNVPTAHTYLFHGTFANCSNLATIPDGLFDNFTIAYREMFHSTFQNCRSLVSIPAGLFANITETNYYQEFAETFAGCTSLTSIPADLWENLATINGGFIRTFAGCTSLTSIPADLFGNVQTVNAAFEEMFMNCTSLTSIPDGFFAFVTGYAQTKMFKGTFKGCTSLTAIPENLFSGLTMTLPSTSGAFAETFAGCTSLSGYIPTSTFYGLTSQFSSPSMDDMWLDTFTGTQLVTTCPSNTRQYITGYEGNTNGTTWNGKVSCMPCTTNKPANSTFTGTMTAGECDWECDHSYFLTTAGTCERVTTCNGATYWNAGVCRDCPTGFEYNTNSGKVAATQCAANCDGGLYMPNVYTQVEYIQAPSSGGAYIDTGFTHGSPNVRGVIRIGVATTLANSNNVNFIGNQVSGLGGYSVGWNKFFKLWTEASGNRLDGPNYTLTGGVVHEFEYAVTNSTRSLTYGGQTVSDTFTGGGIVSPANICLFDNGQQQNNRWFKGRIYGIKWYEDEMLVHDFVAARREADGVLGMYDKVTGTFATNAGGGTFTAGADVGPLGGGACIDVGVGYWAPGFVANYGDVVTTRNACPAGLTTVGYGHAADEANDCGREMHIGNGVIYTRRDKATTPSLNIMDSNGTMYYISASPTDHSLSGLHLGDGTNQWTLYDDSLLHGERDFFTGERITE